MLASVKGWIKIYSIILLSVLIIRSFLKSKGDFRKQLIGGIKTGSLVPVIIYLFNI